MCTQKCTIKLASKNKESLLLLNSYNTFRSDYFKGVEMLKQSLYTQVRMECMINGKSRRQVSREYGIHRSSVDKALIHVKPPGYCRKAGIYYPVLGSEYRGFIEEVMLLDKTVLRKHRHTAKRIYDRLCDEKGYKGSYDSVKRYVFRQREKINPKEMFVPLYHPLGQAQADFGQCKVRIGGKLEKGYFFALKLCNSDDTFIMIYPSENLVSWCDGHARAFEYFGGVPNKIIYDNSKCLVKKILFNGSRELTTGFLELQSHYLFKADFCALGKGNEKGKVEGGIKYSRRNYLTPIPDCVSWEELNSYLVRRCIDRRDQKQAKQSESIGDRYLKEKSHLLPLPSDKYESFETKLVKVNSLSVVNYRTNEYSVPTE